MSVEITTPVGRLVWGHPGRAIDKKNQRTKEPVLDKQGKQVKQWVFGVAFTKAEFAAHIWPSMQQVASVAFPNGFPADFAWKFKDGDGFDKQGNPYSKREGYAGNVVLNISTEAFAPPVYKYENGAYRQMQPEEYKTGDYFAVNLNLKYNGNAGGDGAGLYVNPIMLVHVGYGQEIVSSGKDPSEVFGQAQFALPPGASAMPVAAPVGLPTGPQQFAASAPTMTGQPVAGMPVQGGFAHTSALPATGFPSNGAPLPQPAHDFVHNAGQQAAPVAGAPFPGFPQPR